MKLRSILCAAVLAAQATAALAADVHGRYAANYPATLPCADITSADTDSEVLVAIAAFTEGWFAAHAKLTPGIFDYTPWQPVEYLVAQVRAYCTAHPDDVLLAALDQLTAFLAANALTDAEDPKAVKNGDQVIFVYPSILAQIQQSLRTLGYASTADGDPVAGLSAFQRSEGLPESGLPDLATLQRLFSKTLD